MATSTTCRRCGGEFQMTRMSMIDYYDLCYPCRRDEDKDGVLIVSQIFKDRGYKIKKWKENKNDQTYINDNSL